MAQSVQMEAVNLPPLLEGMSSLVPLEAANFLIPVKKASSLTSVENEYPQVLGLEIHLARLVLGSLLVAQMKAPRLSRVD